MSQNSTSDLNTYYRWARQCICKFAPKAKIQSMLANQDILSEIVNKLIDADLKWNGQGSKTGYRKAQGRFAVMRIAYRKPRKRKIHYISLDDERCLSETNMYHFIEDRSADNPKKKIEQEENIRSVSKLMSNCLTERQRSVVEDYYLKGKTLEEIGPSKQAAHQCLSKAICNLRKTAILNNE
jgi:RNA polymerase sigma factor (sigma-70 family)